MAMNRRNLLILSAVLIVLGGYVYFAEIRGKTSSAEETPTGQPPLWTIAAEDIIGLEIEQPVTAAVVRLTHNKELGWQCYEPPLEATDQARVQQVVSQLVNIRASRVLSETNEPLSVFGLAAPSYVIRIKLPGEDEKVLRIGDKNPQGTAYYAQVAGQGTGLVEGQQPIYLLPTYAIDKAIDFLTSPPEQPTPTPEPTAPPSSEETPTPQE